MTLVAKVLTVSDGVAAGTRDDRSGQALIERLTADGYDVVAHRVCADGIDAVAAALHDLSDGFAGLVVTTGGTGFGPRDLTPEGTRVAITRDAPGLAEAMRRASDTDGRGFGMLSRGVCGVAGAALVCNLPGSSSGALECLDAILPVVPHALELLAGGHPH
ncbi:MAG TPA: MogA/MoaB family molybdenum cofactor biosynthesis protein [Acidimicrobiia bacterium]|nr:MogA/MoaB family molybdenum cofactor biosynthesis protein [Acidimicrobiia bacterium]